MSAAVRRKRAASPDLIATASALVALAVVAAAGLQSRRSIAPPRVKGAASRFPSTEAGLTETRSGAEAKGRAAETPVEIPARGWKDIALRVYGEIASDRLLAVAAGVTFYALLALFPAIVALVSLYGLTADLGSLRDHLDTFRGVAPKAAIDFVGEQVARIVTKSDGQLGFAFVFGLATALWSSNAGVKAMFDALNVVYEEREKRSFVMLNLSSLAFTLGAILFVLLAFNAVVVLPIALRFVWLGDFAETLISLGRWPVLFLSVLLGLTLLYRFGPSRRSPKWRWAAPGSLAAGALWVAGSVGFSWYAENLANFDKTYGPLGAAIGFMLWMWMSVIVVLLGGELNAEMEHQTAKDSTRGAPKPMGLRGAKMADTVAE
jgi:membrane protein